MAEAIAQARLPGLGRVLTAQVRYQLLLLIRTPRALIAGLVMPGLILALRLGGIHHSGDQVAASLAALMGGLVVFGTLSTAYLTHATGLVVAREDGVLRRWRATALPGWGYFAGRITATVLLADLTGLVLVLVGVGMAGMRVTAGAVASLLVAVTVGAIALAAVGTAVTTAIPTSQAANPVLTISYFPLVIFSGALGAIGGVPDWLSRLMSYLPAQPVVDAATRALHGSGLSLMPGRDLAVLAGWALAGLLVSVRFFRWDPHRPAHARPSASKG